MQIWTDLVHTCGLHLFRINQKSFTFYETQNDSCFRSRNDTGFRVIEIDAENGGTEVEALLDNRKLELYFDGGQNWVYTKRITTVRT